MNRPATLLVLLLAGLLAGCGGGSRPTGIRTAETPADDVAEYQPRWRSHTVDSTQYRKVFLAGTIDMGRSADWQAALVARFRDSIGGRWLFFNPRRREFHASPAEMEYQVAWELAHLEAADLIVMNLLGDSRSPISLLEMGLYARSGKLFVACSPDYYRYAATKRRMTWKDFWTRPRSSASTGAIGDFSSRPSWRGASSRSVRKR